MAQLRRSKQDKALLDRLQQDSWQLELILTGFVILGLFAGLESIEDWAGRLSRAPPSGGESLLFLFPLFVYFAYLITLINLLIHVLIRGLHTLELHVYGKRGRRNVPDTVRLEERIFVPFYRE